MSICEKILQGASHAGCPVADDQESRSFHAVCPVAKETRCLWSMLALMGILLAISIYMVRDAWPRRPTVVPYTLRLVRLLNFLYILFFELSVLCRIFDRMNISVVLRNIHCVAADIAMVAFMINVAQSSTQIQMKPINHRLRNIKYILIVFVSLRQLIFTVLALLAPSPIMNISIAVTAVILWAVLGSFTTVFLIRIIRVVRSHIRSMKPCDKDASELHHILVKFCILTGGATATWIYYLVYIFVKFQIVGCTKLVQATPCGMSYYMLFVPVTRFCLLAYFAHVPRDHPETERVVEVVCATPTEV
eukprot:88968_1